MKKRFDFKIIITCILLAVISIISIIVYEVSTVNVRDFGAKGDGKTDDTDAIQKAINYVLRNDGGIVYFPNGIYIVNKTLKFNR